MFITNKQLSRRTVLKGMGVTVALPFLEAMVPARSAFGAVALTKAQGLDDSTLTFALAADDYLFSIGAVALGLMAGAASVVILRTGVVWRWIAILGFAEVVLNVVSDLATTQHSGVSSLDFLGFIVLLATAMFVLAVSILMLVHKEQPEAMPAALGSPAVTR